MHHVITASSPSKECCPLGRIPSTRARSRATDGFSAMISCTTPPYRAAMTPQPAGSLDRAQGPCVGVRMIRWACLFIAVTACAGSGPPPALLFPAGTGDCPDPGGCGVPLDEEAKYAPPDEAHEMLG